MPFSLRHGFTQNLANRVSITPLQFTEEPLVKLRINALLENRQTFNTNNSIKPEK
jgi:hypothetical protein